MRQTFGLPDGPPCSIPGDAAASAHRRFNAASIYTLRKKAKRHLIYLTAAQPTALSVLDLHTHKGPDRVCGLRRDSLGLLLSLSNVQPGSRALVLDGRAPTPPH